MAAKKKATKSKAAAKKAPAKKAPAKKAAPAKKTAKKTAKRAAAKKAGPAIVHWEIQAVDPARVQSFYGELFGWSINTNNPMNYGMVDSSGKEGINGGIGGSAGGGSRLLVYATVKDINATLAKAESLGAKTLMPRTDIGPVIMAIFEDIEGNSFGVLEG
jgi:predicted enzyme related to lactoylglutathione lyase